MDKGKRYDLHDRFVEFAVRVIRLSEALPETRAGRHVGSQLLRSGTSSAPNYAEAQSAESRKDFVHKLKVALKELRETLTWLMVVQRAGWLSSDEKIKPLMAETDELIAIVFASIETARKNQRNET